MLRRRALTAAVSVAAVAAVVSGASGAQAVTVNPITIGTAPVTVTKPTTGTGAVVNAGNTQVNLVVPVPVTKPTTGPGLPAVVGNLPVPVTKPTTGSGLATTVGNTPVSVTKPTTGTGAVLNAGDANVTVKLPARPTQETGEGAPAPERKRYLVTLVNKAKDAKAADKVTALLKTLGAKVVSQSQATSATAQSYVVETSAAGAQALSKLPCVSGVTVEASVTTK